jgi:mono/diheme cytochrome c family protein
MHRRNRIWRPLLIVAVAVSLVSLGAAAQRGGVWKAEIPRVWVDAQIAALEIPLADAAASPRHVSADYYYQIPVQQILKTYPVYAPGMEPPGYIDRLATLEPEVAFDESRLVTEADWIAAGGLVFDAPVTTGGLGGFGGPGDLYVRDPAWYRHTKAPVARDGTLPFYRYVIAQKGKVEVGILACGMCHTRVMADGSIVKGAQGNFGFDRAIAYDYRRHGNLAEARALEHILFATPRPSGLEDRAASLSIDELAAAHEAIPPGVLARHRSSTAFPPQIPDLIGVKDRRYLDRSGLQRHGSLVDLMRYAALNQGMDDLASFRDFIPLAVDGKRPEPGTQLRYSDAQLYALALYIYSLQPPPNPNAFDSNAERGRRVFERQRCGACHTPPLYTNNRLTPAAGFTIPADHRTKYDVVSTSVGTDPRLTMQTRRGTGYYKVPSLKGVWYRGPFEHNGSVATLEDWFDPRRLRDDYVPTGFAGAGVKSRAVRGHEFGLALSDDDRRSLIAFLKTL